MHHLDVAPDLVLSGVNPGPNLGHDVHYSGTAAGALEAAWHGVPAMALSHDTRDTSLFGGMDDALHALLARLIPLARHEKVALNVNLPAVDRGPWPGLRTTFTGQRRYSTEVHQRTDPRGGDYLWIGGARVAMSDLPGSDCNAIRDGYVSITPLGDDLTLHHRLEPLQGLLDAADPTPLESPAPAAGQEAP